MYRPNGWPDETKYNYHKEIDEEVFEAGADAYEKALLKNGLKVNNLSIENQGKGTVIFIPDEE